MTNRIFMKKLNLSLRYFNCCYRSFFNGLMGLIFLDDGVHRFGNFTTSATVWQLTPSAPVAFGCEYPPCLCCWLRWRSESLRAQAYRQRELWRSPQRTAVDGLSNRWGMAIQYLCNGEALPVYPDEDGVNPLSARCFWVNTHLSNGIINPAAFAARPLRLKGSGRCNPSRDKTSFRS